TGVVVCLVCVVVTMKLIQGGFFSHPADSGSDPVGPLPELTDPVPVTPPPVPDLPPNGDPPTPPAPIGRVDPIPLPSHPVSGWKPGCAKEDQQPSKRVTTDYYREEVPPPHEELPAPPREEGPLPLPIIEVPPPEPVPATPAVRIVPAPERGPLVNL